MKNPFITGRDTHTSSPNIDWKVELWQVWTDQIRILHIGCLLGVFDLDVRLFFPILAQKRPGPTDEKMKKKNQVFYCDQWKTSILRFLRKKTHDSSRKIIKKVGQFYVTLICFLNLRKNRMIVVAKISKKYVTFTAYARIFLYTFQSYSEQRVRGLWDIEPSKWTFQSDLLLSLIHIWRCRR